MSLATPLKLFGNKIKQFLSTDVIPAVNLGTGVTDNTTVLYGDNVWRVPPGGASSDIALSLMAPTTDETITAGNSAVVYRKYTIANGKKLTIGSNSAFIIL